MKGSLRLINKNERSFETEQSLPEENLLNESKTRVNLDRSIPDKSNHKAGYLKLAGLALEQVDCASISELNPAISNDEESSARSSNRSKKKLPPEQEVSINETVMSIVGNDLSWHQIQQQMKDANVVTSLGMKEICEGILKTKATEIQNEKLEKAKRLEEEDKNRGSLSRIRRRISMML